MESRQIPDPIPLRKNAIDVPLCIIWSKKGFGVDYWNSKEKLIKHDRYDYLNTGEEARYFKAAEKSEIPDHHILGRSMLKRINDVAKVENKTE